MFDEAPLADRPLMQDPAFAAALKLCGQNPVILPDGHMLLKRRFFGIPVAMLPRALPPEDLPDQMVQSGLGRTPLILSPEAPCRMPRALPLARPRSVAMLDLTGGNAACRARLHPKWRNQLVRVEKRAVHITHGALPADVAHPIFGNERQQARKRGYAGWPIGLTAAFAHVAPDQTHLFSATHKGKTIAHMLFLTHGRRATYHIGHITPLGRRLYAHNLLLWNASRFLASFGHVSLDLGVLDANTTGLNRFKLRTGAQAQKTGGTWMVWTPFRPRSRA